VKNHAKLPDDFYLPSTKPPTYSQGQTLLQFVRVYGLRPYDFVGREYKQDSSYLELLLRAIDNAEKFIYLEEQFFNRVPEVDDALAKAVNERNVTVVVIGARVNENEQLRREVGTLRGKTLRQNRFVFIKFKVLGGHLPALIHSKTWVFDDEFALVGSANYWDGSLLRPGNRLDSEFGVGIMAPVVASLRVALWNRLLDSWPGAAKIPSSATDFFDQLAVLMDRSAEDLKKDTKTYLTPGPSSPFEAMPDYDHT
jgi:phosphatidylserine/phosphatidylglycerophosphate/cardiolipin synthase-like enzyme